MGGVGMNEVLLITAMAAVTFIPRLLPFALASRLRLPKYIQQALSYVPIAILSVIITQSILYRNAALALHMDNPFFWSGLVAFIMDLIQKRLFVTILMSLISYSILKFGLLL
ncbi:MAG: branched-subunit amino acid transport protein [Paraglaciecola sp.]|jgi:branched-subunit amino acid transport protein